ncbi:MAG: hypothetical protein LBE44_01955 [Microbacterium hominis]|nr:hypothetical protein [Microbacterium hominis]
MLLAVIVVVVGVVCGDFSYGKRRERIWMERGEGTAGEMKQRRNVLGVCVHLVSWNGP